VVPNRRGLRIQGPSERIDELLAAVASEEALDELPLDFERIAATPGKTPTKSPPREWRVDHSGTESGALGPTLKRETPDTCAFTFGTSWSPPLQVLAALARKYPDLMFALTFSEPGIGYAGATFFERGGPVADLHYAVTGDALPSVRGMQFCAATAIDELELCLQAINGL
jgi:hypothetical protein